jgi:hypothetical protein
MIEITLPQTLTRELMALVPDQMAFVNRSFREGHLLNYTLSLEKGKLWIVVSAESELDVLTLLGEMPISPHVDSDIIPLTFHQMVNAFTPQFSVN